MIDEERAVVIAVHPKMEYELKRRKEELEKITGKPIRGGLTTYSKFAAFELETIRKSGEEINREILKVGAPEIYEFDVEQEKRQFIAYEIFKKLFILTSILNKKKDHRQINVDLTKIKGLKKNDAKIYY
jgi:hypothetical protein